MIRKLRISNFALIEHLELDLKSGFTIVTGETGSGKSILLNAFSLMMGERASTSIVGTYSKKAIVELHIANREEDALFFKTHNLDVEGITILRREVVKDGKSRAFINDTPVSLSVLKEFTTDKLLIHSQYNTYELKSKQTQLELYDSLTGLTKEVKKYSQVYHLLLQKRESLNKMIIEFRQKSKDVDYNQFLIDELNSLHLDSRKYKSIEADLFKLENGDEIKDVLYQIQAFNEENGTYSNIRNILKQLDKLESVDTEITDLRDRLNKVTLEIQELANESGFILDSVIDDPERKMELTSQWDGFNRMLLKHKVNNQEDLLRIHDRLSISTGSLLDLESDIAKRREVLNKLEKDVGHQADTIHKSRIGSQNKISDLIKGELKSLKLPHTEVFFEMSKGALCDTGITQLNLLFSANLGHPKIEIEKAASGGELSRFMLALLKLISESRNMPTILFDEIDSGVSGDVAQKIGHLLKNMGINTQLIVISHLPQVASKAKQHLRVHKNIVNKITSTFVDELNNEERIREIARLMSGENVTKSAIETAKALMN